MSALGGLEFFGGAQPDLDRAQGWTRPHEPHHGP
jgi:hypothetical protein